MFCAMIRGVDIFGIVMFGKRGLGKALRVCTEQGSYQFWTAYSEAKQSWTHCSQLFLTDQKNRPARLIAKLNQLNGLAQEFGTYSVQLQPLQMLRRNREALDAGLRWAPVGSRFLSLSHAVPARWWVRGGFLSLSHAV